AAPRRAARPPARQSARVVETRDHRPCRDAKDEASRQGEMEPPHVPSPCERSLQRAPPPLNPGLTARARRWEVRAPAAIGEVFRRVASRRGRQPETLALPPHPRPQRPAQPRAAPPVPEA